MGICPDGICMLACRSDDDCASNERCSQGQCKLTCKLDNDCFLGHVCLGGVNIEEESNVEEEVSNSIHQRFKPEDLFYNVPQPIPQPWYQPYLYYLIPTYSPEIGSNEEPAAYDY